MIDARPVVDPRRTGIGHYASALLKHVPATDPQNSYLAWYLDVRGLGTRPRRFAGWARNLSERASRIPSRVFGPFSVRTGLPRVEWLTGAFDLFVATNFLAPPTASRGVVLVVHDLAFDRLPETAPHHDDRWRRLFERGLGEAAGVIVPSTSAKEDLLHFHPVEAEKIEVIHHGTDAEAFWPASQDEVDSVRAKYGIGGPYILFLGGLEPRKNLEGLVRAFGQISERDVNLVVAGGRVAWAPGYEERVAGAIAALPSDVRGNVVRTGYVPDPDRRALLTGAEILAYPSLYEGFGFPVLEAFAANVPVVTSSTSAMPEVAGDAAMLVDPMDPASIAHGLDGLLRDDDLRDVLRAAGIARVTAFTWERCARETVAALALAQSRAG